MTFRNAFGALSMAVIAVAAPYGCSSSGDSSGAPPDAGCGNCVVDAAKPDAPHDAAPIDAAVTCAPADVTTFQPPTYVPAVGASQGKCTPAQIQSFYDDCLAPNATQATCAPFSRSTGTAENKACAACIVTADSATSYGAIVEHKGVVNINIPGCMELTDPAGGLMCAKAYQAADACDRAACAANCPVTDDASFQLYQACLQQAGGGGCKSYAQGSACASAEADGGPAARCFMGQSFQDLYSIVVPIFCGGSGDAGGG